MITQKNAFFKAFTTFSALFFYLLLPGYPSPQKYEKPENFKNKKKHKIQVGFFSPLKTQVFSNTDCCPYLSNQPPQPRIPPTQHHVQGMFKVSMGPPGDPLKIRNPFNSISKCPLKKTFSVRN